MSMSKKRKITVRSSRGSSQQSSTGEWSGCDPNRVQRAATGRGIECVRAAPAASRQSPLFGDSGRAESGPLPAASEEVTARIDECDHRGNESSLRSVGQYKIPIRLWLRSPYELCSEMSGYPRLRAVRVPQAAKPAFPIVSATRWAP